MSKVLCVDDDDAVLEYLTEILEDMQFEVTSCLSAEEALEINNITDYHVIFTDIKMPGLNGFEFIRAVREQGYSNPIIAISGIADLDKSKFGDLSQPLTRPSRFIRKPYTVADIFAVMKIMNFI